MKQYRSKIPLKFKHFRHVPNYELQFCTNIKDKIDTGTLNEFGVNIYRDSKNENLFYNKTYHTIYDSQYYIFGSYYINSGATKILNIQFPLTHSTAVLTENAFNQQNGEIDFIDPYELRMFGNQCCVGNIDYEPLGRVEPYLDMKDGLLYYSIWCDIMGRCYDPSHRLYSLYGAHGVLPALCEWRCFRYFYCMMDTSRHYYTIDPDPNDPCNYLFLNQRIGLVNARVMNHFPAPVRTVKREMDKKLLYRVVEDVL